MPSREPSWPIPLSFAVSLRRFRDSALPPSFPPKVPCYGAPFPPQGPLERVPPTHRYYGSAPTPCHPSLRASLPSPSDTAERLLVRPDARPSAARHGPVESPAPPSGFLGGDDRVSQVPGEPQCMHALLFDPGGTLV